MNASQEAAHRDNVRVIVHNRTKAAYHRMAKEMDELAEQVDAIDAVSGAHARAVAKRIRDEAKAFADVSAIILKG